MKSVIRLVAILAVSVGVFTYLAVRYDAPVHDQKLHYAPTLALTPGYDVQQEFTVHNNDFSTLAMLFTTQPGAVNKGVIKIALWDGDRLVHERQVEANKIPREEMYVVSFPAEHNIKGKRYKLQITGMPYDGFSGGQHVLLVPQKERPKDTPVVVNGASWPYVCYLIPGYRQSGFTSAIVGVAVLILLIVIWIWENAVNKGRKGSFKSGSPNKASSKVSFDWGMHYFWAFAILCIAVEHFLCLTGYLHWSKFWFQTGTVYFLFISGYLCQYLHNRRPDSSWNYYRKKLVNVITPYFVWSALTMLIVYFYGYSRPGVIKPSDITFENIFRHCSKVSGNEVLI